MNPSPEARLMLRDYNRDRMRLIFTTKPWYKKLWLFVTGRAP